MKVFISQPMRGKSSKEIKEERVKAINYIESVLTNVEIIDSYFDDFNKNENPLMYIARSIECLSKADIAFFIGNWYENRGCRIEHQCCIDYGIKWEVI